MKEFIYNTTILFCILLFSNNSFAQTIVIQSPEYIYKTIKIASHYGDNIFLEHELTSNETGKSIFYFDSLKSGIYYIIFPDSSSFEFMYDADYPGKITINELKNKKLQITSAPSITLKYGEYINTMETISENIDSTRYLLHQHGISSKERKSYLKFRDYLNFKTDSLFRNISSEYNGSILDAYIQSQKKVKVPDYVPSTDISNKDSAIWAWRIEYFNKHFLDNFDVTDERLIRTPIYTSIINQYLDKITLQKPETIKAAIDFLISKSTSSASANKFLLDYLLNKYNNLKNAAIYEAAYLYIIENYYLKSEHEWISEKDLEILRREFDRRNPLVIGQVAPDIVLKNYYGRDTSLYSIKSDHTILYFYNYDCELCKITSPELKKLSQKYQADSLVVFGICMGNEMENGIEYIKYHGLDVWINVFADKNTSEISSEYMIQYTPTIYLLDREKVIISKNLTIEELREYLKKYYKF